MFWNPGNTYIEIYVFAFLLIFTFLLNIFMTTLHCIYKRRKKQRLLGHDCRITIENEKKCLLEDIKAAEKQAEAFNIGTDFVQYAKYQREIIKKKRRLDLLTRESQENVPPQARPTPESSAMAFLSFFLSSKALFFVVSFLAFRFFLPQTFSSRFTFSRIFCAFCISESLKKRFLAVAQQLELASFF